MKSKTWGILLACLFVICIGLSLWLLLPKAPAARAEIWSEGKLLYTLDLSVDREKTVTTEKGTNVITVEGGKIAVTQATCPDGHCMKRGYCNAGAQIVCLPNQLVIRFAGKQAVDAIAG